MSVSRLCQIKKLNLLYDFFSLKLFSLVTVQYSITITTFTSVQNCPVIGHFLHFDVLVVGLNRAIGGYFVKRDIGSK